MSASQPDDITQQDQNKSPVHTLLLTISAKNRKYTNDTIFE